VRSRWLAFTALVLVAAACAAVADRADVGILPRVAAHRGGAHLWPENSLLAFRGALGLGVDFLETDVHLTAEGEVVVIHDPTLERTTTGRGPVRAARRAELAAVRLRGADGAPTAERLPTLAELLALLASSRADLLLEIKVDAERVRYAGIEEAVLRLLRGHGLRDRTIVMAFEPETVARVRALDPTIRTALLIGWGQAQSDRLTPGEAVDRARRAGATHIGLNHRLVGADVIGAAHRAKLPLLAWTVNEEADLRRVIGLGVDVVVSDRPDLAQRLVGR